MCRDETLTLEGIDGEALVVPVQVCVSKCAFELTLLRIVRGDYPIRFAFVLEVPSEKQNCFDFFFVLRSYQDVVRIVGLITSVAPTIKLFLSFPDSSKLFTSTKRQEMTLEEIAWLGFDCSRPS